MKKIVLILGCFFLFPQPLLANSDVITEAFGMNMHLRQRVPEAEWETVLDLAEGAGVQWAREQFNWDVIEPTDDEFNFFVYDNIISAYEQHTIKVVGLLTYSSAWASNNSSAADYEFYPPDLIAWSNYVTTVAEQYAGRIDYWEIWNEPNHSAFWKGTTADYVALLETTAAALEAANVNARLVLGGLSGADANYLNSVYQQISDPNLIDVVAIHPYRLVGDNFNYSPESTVNGLNALTIDLYNVKAVMNAHGQSSTPLWLTEVGWTTGTDGVSERRQAEFLMRLYTQALAVPNVRKVFWYSFHDTEADEALTEAHFGIVNNEYSPKAAFSAYQFVRQHLPKHRLKDQTLPGARVIDDFSASRGWHFAGTVCTNGTVDDHDHGTMRVSYAFTQLDNCYAPIALNMILPEPTRALQFKIKGDNDDTVLRLRIIDATGETFQYDLGYMPKEWLSYSVQLNQPANVWGGDEDGKLDQPLTFNAFILDDTDGSRAQGTIYFDDLVGTSQAATYVYRFHNEDKDMYAYWTSGRSRPLTLHLLGAEKIREYRWQKDSSLHQTDDALYTLRSSRAVKFLQRL